MNVLCFTRSVNKPQRIVVVGDNLPGGPREDGELPIDSAYRILFEQTGILADKSLIAEAGRLYAGFTTTRVMDCPFRGAYHVARNEHRPQIIKIEQALKSAKLLPWLQTLISLCIQGRRGWAMTLLPHSHVVRI